MYYVVRCQQSWYAVVVHVATDVDDKANRPTTLKVRAMLTNVNASCRGVTGLSDMSAAVEIALFCPDLTD